MIVGRSGSSPLEMNVATPQFRGRHGAGVDDLATGRRGSGEAVLGGPDAPWPPLDPEASVRNGGFRDREARALLAEFLEERRRSIRRLRELAGSGWDRFREHPRAGRLRTGDLLAAWVDHDVLHARQMVRLLHGIVKDDAAPYAVDYAGAW